MPLTTAPADLTYRPGWDVLVGFGLTLLFLVIAGIVSFQHVRRLATNEDLVAHTHRVLEQIEGVRSTLIDAETGQRGFLLTETPTYLTPYEAAVAELDRRIVQLRELTGDNDAQQARIATLEAQVEAKEAELLRTVTLMRDGQRDEALAIVRSDAGKGAMDAIRATLDELEAEERQLLELRGAESDASYRTTVLAILSTAIVGALLVGCIFWLLHRNTLDRRRAAQVVADERERLQVTLASIGDAVIVTDDAGRVTFMNAVAEELTGWGGEARGRELPEVFRIFNEYTGEPVESPVAKVLREGCIVGLANHTVLVAKDGTRRPIDDSGAPIRVGDQPIGGVVLVFRDISEKHAAAKSEAEASRLMTFRAELGLTLASDLDLEVALQKCVQQLVDHLEVAFARIWTLAEDEPVLELQASAGLYTHLDGPHGRVPVGEFKIGRIAATKQALLTNTVATDPNISDPEWAEREGMTAFAGYPLVVEDRVVGVLAMFARQPLSETIVADMAPVAVSVAQYVDRKRAETKLRDAQQQFRTLADSIPQLAWMARPDGHLFWYNQRWFDYTGTQPEEMEGWGWTAVHDPAELPRVIEKFRRHLASGEPWEDTFPLRRRDGEFRWHLSRALPVRDAEGRIVRWFGTNTDITDRRRMEDELRTLAANLSEADRHKDEFLATLAHELRNPLAPIRNGLEILRLTGEQNAELVHVRDMMDRQLEQMVRLVDDLLDVSRITRNQLELRRTSVELGDVLASAIETSRPLIESNGHKLTTALPAEPVLLHADTTRLAQVFANLLNNAARYTERGGTIQLEAERRGDEVAVTVRDSGLGIPQESLPVVFDMFTQVDRSLERSQTGLGIGLTLVKRLVELHGGAVEAHSGGLGQGSEFVVRLPVAAPTNAPTTEPAAAALKAEPARARRILVVDDNVDSANSLRLMLRMLGHNVAVAHDGVEAVETASTYGPELILLDIGLPRLNGYEACRAIRDQETADRPRPMIVALTGWGQDEDRRRSREAGFDLHLVKPIDVGALTQLLTEP